MFDGIQYLKKIAAENKLVKKEGFVIKEVAGLSGIEPMMQDFQRESNFIIVDNTVDGGVNTNGTGFTFPRVFTCSIVMRHRFNDLADRNAKREMCREIYRQLISRLIHDGSSYDYDALTFIKRNSIRSKEMDVYTMQGATGLTFMIPIAEPADLAFNKNEWE